MGGGTRLRAGGGDGLGGGGPGKEFAEQERPSSRIAVGLNDFFFILSTLQ